MRTALSRLTSHALFIPALALASSLVALTPMAAFAAAPGYTARLAAPLAAPRQAIIDEALWKCAGDMCTASAGSGRAVFTCQQVARKFGEVAAFTAPKGALASEDLAKCNKK